MAPWRSLHRALLLLFVLWTAVDAYHIRAFGSKGESRKSSRRHTESWYMPRDAPTDFEEETTDAEGDEEDVREGCPQNREEAAALGRRCLRKCKTDEDCISSKKKCLCDGRCGWSCVRPDLNCDELEPLENGQFRVSGDYFGARVYYECAENFWMSGPKERMCQGDGRWSGRAPECKKQPSCSSPPGVPHSRTNASDGARDFVINSTVRYTCFPGYDAKGFDVAKCIFYNGSAQWFGPDLKCEPKSCGPPGEVEHGRRMGAMTRFTSSVKYECHEGYELFGRAHRYCQSSGQWSGTLPECRPVQCDKPEDPLNGRAIYDQLLFNSVVRYECHHGFRLKGPSTARCNSQRQWEGAPTHCVEIDCGHPGHLHNGYVEFRSSTLNAKATYNCFDGMKFQGESNTSICLDTGNWSNPLPKCLAPCKIPTLEHAYVNLSTPESRLEHGRRLSVSCHEHYELAYNSTPPRCNNGSWTHLPICAPARCKSLPERPAHGFVIAPKTDHGMRALFRCTDGYQLVGPNVTVCQFGNWTHEAVPLCRETTCSLPEVPNGSFRELTTERPLDPAELIGHGTLVELVCGRGFQVQGQPELRCWQGQWTPGLLPECLPEPCELPALRGGRYLGGYRAGLTISPGSSVEYACDEPHLRQWPPSPLRCRMGRLQPAPPTCLPPPQTPSAPVSGLGAAPEEAPQPESAPAAVVVEEAQGSTASPGPPGGGDAVPRRATSPPPSDRPCSAPERLHNALAFRSSSPSRSEEDGGEDSRGLLQFPHGTEVVFRCIDSAGGGERSTWKLLCEDGSWLGRPEKCEDGAQQLSVPKGERRNRSCVFRNTEPNLEAFQGDRRITDDTLHFPPGSELVFRCKDIGKYSLVGSVRRRCVYGDWDGVKPSCFGLSQENDYALEKPPTILFRPHVMPVAQSNDGKLVVYPGAILHLECLWLRKYGTPKWEVSHKSRKYAEGWTTEPGRDSQLEYRLSIYHAKKDDSGRYTCITPMGHKHSVDIVVSPVHCRPMPSVSGLSVSTATTRMGTKVVFSCDEGQRLRGSQQAMCLPSGNWSAPPPVCQVAECHDITGASDGLVVVKAEQRAVGSRAHFSCPLGYALRGQASVECLDTGQWSGSLPRCEEVVCSALPAPENGYVESEHGPQYRGGQQMQFACRPDHMMLGAGVLECLDNDRWSGIVPKCVPACQYPSVRDGARISSRVSYFYRINETVSFECPEGFQLRGSPMIQCVAKGRWSAAVPRCQPFAPSTSSSHERRLRRHHRRWQLATPVAAHWRQ
ncbi:sushi, von Willebrand factor type A, EGF and pentraxin domain-containing protein 1 isoform X2 [Dermacentor andersoni]|uniref:sushi, von Willebrand factor type A, EGF and pentraxin domain-containing protein 1 isoform X2 n=1 Tax=Dermacentor andersoni TaxID=34620 RepID=UPI002155F657|nr:sushi, von Willebrand factor type A, EGF and pentraxin domain-containing protein 1-like isoform X2 [Dermacentor andersoni]